MPGRAWAADTAQPQGQCTKSPLPGYHLCDQDSGTLGAQGGDIRDWTELGGGGGAGRRWGLAPGSAGYDLKLQRCRWRTVGILFLKESLSPNF